ncbi:MAG: lactonase family protein [Eubacteriales bacterium]|nr:lactonase family protein [Eubacteriales bacterium]
MQYIFTGSYTAPEGTDGVRCFSVTPDGMLTQLCTADVYSPTYVLYQDGLLYAVGRAGSGSCVHTFSFDGKMLTEHGRTPADPDSTLCHLSIVGNTMYAAAYGSGRLVRFALDADGIPDRTEIILYTDSSVHPRQEHSHIHSAFPSPDEKFLLVCDLGGDKIHNYQIHADGSLTELQQIITPAGSGPRHLTYSSDGTFVYAITELSAQVIVYARNTETGILTQVQITHCAPQERPDDTLSADIHLSKDGLFLYASTRGADCMAVYAVLPDGKLDTPVFLPSYASGPRNFSFSPNGYLAAIGGQYSNNIAICPVDCKTGTLSAPVCTAEMPQATCAQWVEVDA